MGPSSRGRGPNGPRISQSAYIHSMPLSIPLVDISLPDRIAAAKIGEACRSHGFFIITAHGIEEAFISHVFDQTRKLFALPLDEKQAMKADSNNRGWTPYQEETLDPAKQSEGDTKVRRVWTSSRIWLTASTHRKDFTLEERWPWILLRPQSPCMGRTNGHPQDRFLSSGPHTRITCPD
jgi:hypothetical protein